MLVSIIFAVSLYCCCCCSPHLLALAQRTHPSEVSALHAIATNLIDTDNLLEDWRKGDPCIANWTGVLCFDGADGYFHVRVLLLMNMNLSGTLAPQLGQFSQLHILNFMWNQLTGSIPKEIGNIASLRLLLLNGNKLSGSLPDELGYLSNLDRFQIDQNQLSGSIPKSFSNLHHIKHIHFNNNSLSGQIPPELSNLTTVVHLLLDNNNLSGYLPSEFSTFPQLRILSLRNCSLEGPIPDLSWIQNLSYLDLSQNQLSGTIPPNNLSNNLTTIVLSDNQLNGSIPESFSYLPLLQKLSLDNNFFTGSVTVDLWQNRSFSSAARLLIDLQNNSLSNIIGDLDPPVNVMLSQVSLTNLTSHATLLTVKQVQMLVYEFMPNGTLQDWLSAKSGETLNFGARLRIALGAAKGILYLHTEANPPIFHRDVKASNILLGSKLTAKVADFGLSRVAPVVDDEGALPEHVSTIVKGTPGYLDPEYFLTRKLTDKSDVYSIGVVFLEILTGKQPILHGKNIVREVNLAHQSGAMFSIIDTRMGSYPSECVESFIALGLKCCQDKPEDRPSIVDVVRELENILRIMPETGVDSSESRSKFFSKSVSSSSLSANTSRDLYALSSTSGGDLITGASLTVTPR